jgi:hypothetical protein
MTDTADTTDERPQYSTHIHGATYTEAAGADLLAFLIRTAMRDSEALPAPALYAGASA